MPLSRAEVVQGLLTRHSVPSYLEIGVSTGATFHAVKASRKVAVDPHFDFDVEAARASQPEALYHEITSDEYFGRVAAPSDRFDVIFLDGLHTLEQTLRDFTNALPFLAPKGVIVIDDVIPDSHFAAIRDLAVFRKLRHSNIATSASWMGDVYRVVFFIETFFQQFSYRTVADNHGQLIAWQARRTSVPERSVEAVARTAYEDVLLQPDTFRLLPFADILGELQEQLGKNP